MTTKADARDADDAAMAIDIIHLEHIVRGDGCTAGQLVRGMVTQAKMPSSSQPARVRYTNFEVIGRVRYARYALRTLCTARHLD